MLYCIFCSHKLNWQADFTFEEYGELGDGVVGTYTCSNYEKCGFEFEIKIPIESDSTYNDSLLYNEGYINYFNAKE